MVLSADADAACRGEVVHATRQAFEDARRRDAELTLAGYTGVRFTWRQVSDEPMTVRQTVARLLGRSPR